MVYAKRVFQTFLIVYATSLMAFDKVVIWGHKLHSHTHSYIHEAFYRTFKHLGYEVYWLDNHDDLSRFDLSNSLFIVEGQVDQKIPVRLDCDYILHNCTSPKYRPLYLANRAFALQVYSDDVLERTYLEKVEPCIYRSLEHRIVYMPWATDLLPHEIDAIKEQITTVKRSKEIVWVGTIGTGEFGNRSELSPFFGAAKKAGVPLQTKRGISRARHAQLVKGAYMAPAIVGAWQKKKGYIPCRIFKNISYGQIGITNSERVFELFDGAIVYDPNPAKLFHKAKKRLETLTLDELFELMDFVRDRHTYINRVELLLDFLAQVKKQPLAQ